jgi:CDP-glycerol glycerophosphotransferase (TagB/SpsB family)
VVSMPDDSVDTYALIDSSDVVVTHNSTVGLEAAAVGKPVYYCGRNVFEACRSVRRLRDEAEVGAALDEPGASEPLDALKFLFFFGHHGIRYTLYQPGGLVTGTWKGRELNAPFSLLRNLKLRVTRGGV